MINRTKYYDLTAKLQAISYKTDVYLTDENIDIQNCGGNMDSNSEMFYADMYFAACSAAGSRAEEAGLDINDLLGYIIY